MKRSGTKGFSLVELLVVLTIMGLLANLSLPHFRDSIDRANLSEYLLAIDATRTAVNSAYQLNNRSMFPGGAATRIESLSSGPRAAQLREELGISSELFAPGLSLNIRASDDEFGHFAAGTDRSYLGIVANGRGPNGPEGKRKLKLIASSLPESSYHFLIPGTWLMIILVEDTQ